jgi:RimJ/RimL family protein N-acetyltransferase
MKEVESLQTPGLLLHRMIADDLDDLTRMHLDPRIMDNLGGVRTPKQTRDWLERQMGHWERCGFGLWLARERQTGRFAGRGGLHYIEIEGREEVEVGYSFLPEFWGRGLATELACESIRAGFTLLNFPELICFTLTTNLASQRVMRKAGFRYERDLVYKDEPHVLYRLRRDEWQPTGKRGASAP